MVAMQIRDVPNEVRDAVAARAALRGQSMQAYLLELVTDAAGRASNQALLDGFDGRSDGSVMTDHNMRRVLDADRAERDGDRLESSLGRGA